MHTQWTKGKYPGISQNQAKAAALRTMTYWVSEVVDLEVSNDMHKIRAAMVKEWVNADKVCRRAGRFLSSAEHERLCTHTENYLLCFNALPDDSLERKTFLFKVIPKFHAASHVYDIRVNPRATHCYADEDRRWCQVGLATTLEQ